MLYDTNKCLKLRDSACPDCPWRRSNRNRKTSGGWYTKSNLKRLWSGLRTGKAPGMTCHPTDPNNPPTDDGKQAAPDAETYECYGALLLVARELKAVEEAKGDFTAYRRERTTPLTREGLMHWINRAAFPAALTGCTKLPETWTEDDDISRD